MCAGIVVGQAEQIVGRATEVVGKLYKRISIRQPLAAQKRKHRGLIDAYRIGKRRRRYPRVIHEAFEIFRQFRHISPKVVLFRAFIIGQTSLFLLI